MPRIRSPWFVTAALAASSSPGYAQHADTLATAQAASPATHSDADDGVAVPDGAHSVRIVRDGEVLHLLADASSPRRGAAARDALLPAMEAARGPGCETQWVRVADRAWVCMDEARYAGDPPTTAAEPRVADGEELPYGYAFASFAGVRTYRTLDDVDDDNWAEELERGMGVAVDRTDRHQGRVFVHTVSGRWIAMRELNWARPSSREGVAYDDGEAVTSVGFTARRVSTFADGESAAGVGHVRANGFVDARVAVHVREERTVRGRRVVRIDAGWVRADVLRRPETATMPDDLGPHERWVDVDVRRQMLVAYEGTRPVHAALVSTGGAGHTTVHGTFRVWAKLATSDMSNADDDAVDTVTNVYAVERVPWVMYFHDDQALHGAYWHDQFGTARSHGCVNLAPRDARWLFAWAPPTLPPGWNAVLPNDRDPGMRVRVR